MPATTIPVRILMNGVTGRMGGTQHLQRSIISLASDGGVRLGDGRIVVPVPILAGRDASKLESLASKLGIEDWTTDIGAALASPDVDIVFDAAMTQHRPELLERAIREGKHVYCEKPIALDSTQAFALADLAEQRGVKNGVVQDKLWLPGLEHLKRLIDEGRLGRILSAKIDFGYWVFDGIERPAQRPSWNYRVQDGGGIIFDMMPHWYYLISNLLAPPRRLVFHAAIQLPERADEMGSRYQTTAEDAAFGIVLLDNGITVQVANSWCTRVRRDDLNIIQVDGTLGSAVAGLNDVWFQAAADTPTLVWNPDRRQDNDYYSDWQHQVAATAGENAFRAQWRLFIKHVFDDGEFPWSLRSGARGVCFAEKARKSWQQGCWVDL